MLPHFERIAEERIRKAQEEGCFDNLEGAGKPLVLEDDSMIPPDLRMAYKILKNGGYVPPEVRARKDILVALDLLETMQDEKQRYRQIQKLNYLVSRASVRHGRNLVLEENDDYYRKVVERLRVAREKHERDNDNAPLP